MKEKMIYCPTKFSVTLTKQANTKEDAIIINFDNCKIEIALIGDDALELIKGLKAALAKINN